MNLERTPVGRKIVTRPYSSVRFADESLANEIKTDKIRLTSDFGQLEIGIEVIPSFLSEKVINLFQDLLEDESLIFKSDIFLHLKQKQNLEKLAPKVQIYTSDIVMGNLNKSGFYRLLISADEGANYKRLKKDMREVIRLYRAGVLEVGHLYSGCRLAV